MGGPLSPSVLLLMASCARLSRIKLTASFCLRDYGSARSRDRFTSRVDDRCNVAAVPHRIQQNNGVVFDLVQAPNFHIRAGSGTRVS
jgi:hypothetical protein